MASSKLMSSSASSSKSRNSDLSRQRPSKPKPSQPPSSSTVVAPHQTLNAFSGSYNPMTVDGLIRDVYGNTLSHADATLLDAQIDLIDAASLQFNTSPPPPSRPKTVDEVWQEIVSGESRNECKEEVAEEMMTLEDFLARAGAVEEDDIKDLQMAAPPTEAEGLSGSMFGFDQIPLSPFQSIEKVEGSGIGFGNREVEMVGSGGRGRGKRPRAVLEPLDKAAQQRQKRMIKNRESAARSRERKQAYQAELESLAVRLEEEHDQLLKEKAERTAERYNQLMENIIPIVEKRRLPRVLRRVRSFEW